MCYISYLWTFASFSRSLCFHHVTLVRTTWWPTYVELWSRQFRRCDCGFSTHPIIKRRRIIALRIAGNLNETQRDRNELDRMFKYRGSRKLISQLLINAYLFFILYKRYRSSTLIIPDFIGREEISPRNYEESILASWCVAGPRDVNFLIWTAFT